MMAILKKKNSQSLSLLWEIDIPNAHHCRYSRLKSDRELEAVLLVPKAGFEE